MQAETDRRRQNVRHRNRRPRNLAAGRRVQVSVTAFDRQQCVNSELGQLGLLLTRPYMLHAQKLCVFLFAVLLENIPMLDRMTPRRCDFIIGTVHTG